ncbi:hypothetical protein SH449x_001532 [Pirellulaceae bacterium SH449]
MHAPSRDQIIGFRMIRIGHSHYSEPQFVIEGIGPATFRSHFVELENGLVLDLFTAYLSIASAEEMLSPAETEGIPASDLMSKTVTAVYRDDVFSTLLVLDDLFYLRDANDGCYGNPLRAGVIHEDYTPRELSEFLDYWTEQPIKPL